MLVSGVRSDKNVAEIDPAFRACDLNLAEDSIEDVSLGVLGVLEVLDKVESAYE